MTMMTNLCRDNACHDNIKLQRPHPLRQGNGPRRILQPPPVARAKAS